MRLKCVTERATREKQKGIQITQTKIPQKSLEKWYERQSDSFAESSKLRTVLVLLINERQPISTANVLSCEARRWKKHSKFTLRTSSVLATTTPTTTTDEDGGSVWRCVGRPNASCCRSHATRKPKGKAGKYAAQTQTWKTLYYYVEWHQCDKSHSTRPDPRKSTIYLQRMACEWREVKCWSPFIIILHIVGTGSRLCVCEISWSCKTV